MIEILFLIIVATIFIMLLIDSDKSYYIKKRFVNVEKTYGINSVLSHFSPKEDSKLFKYYENILKYSFFSVDDFFKVKIFMLLLCIVLIPSIKLTNIKMVDEKLFEKKHNAISSTSNMDDYIFKESSEYEAIKTNVLKNSIKILDANTKGARDGALKNITADFVFEKSKMDYIHKVIHLAIVDLKVDRIHSYYEIQKSVYNMLVEYYSIRKINYLMYLVTAFMMFSLPDLLMGFSNLNLRDRKNKELNRLSTLLLINVSLKSLTFLEIMKRLRDEAYFYRDIFDCIIEFNNTNTLVNDNEYRKLFKNMGFYNEKLFFEKIQTANDNNFDAVMFHIKNNFQNVEEEEKTQYWETLNEINEVGEIYGFILIFGYSIILIIPFIQYFFDVSLNL